MISVLLKSQGERNDGNCQLVVLLCEEDKNIYLILSSAQEGFEQMRPTAVFRKQWLNLQLIESEDYLGNLKRWYSWEDWGLGMKKTCGHFREEKSKYRSVGLKRMRKGLYITFNSTYQIQAG